MMPHFISSMFFKKQDGVFLNLFGKNWVIESGIQLKSYLDIRTSIDYISLSVLLG